MQKRLIFLAENEFSLLYRTQVKSFFDLIFNYKIDIASDNWDFAQVQHT